MTYSKTSWLLSVAKKWRTFYQLPLGQRLVLVEALCLYPLAAASLRLLGFVRTQNMLLAIPLCPLQNSLPKCDSTTIAQLSSTAASLIPLSSPRCLLRSLVCSRLLYQRALPHQLRIGVQKHKNDFRAHAWIEHPPVSHSPSEEVAYTPLV